MNLYRLLERWGAAVRLSTLRTLVALLIGIAAATLAIGVWQFSLWLWWEPPPNDLPDPLLQVPARMLWLLLGGYMLGAALGAGVAARLAGPAAGPVALAVGAIQTAVAVLTLMRLPHPVWFLLLSPFVHLPAAMAGARLAIGRWPGGKEERPD